LVEGDYGNENLKKNIIILSKNPSVNLIQHHPLFSSPIHNKIILTSPEKMEKLKQTAPQLDELTKYFNVY
jgi:hypothetical protein